MQFIRTDTVIHLTSAADKVRRCDFPFLRNEKIRIAVYIQLHIAPLVFL